MTEEQRKFGTQLILAGLYFLAVALISYTLLNEHQQYRAAYLLYPVSMTVAFLATHRKIKLLAIWLSLATVFIGGHVEPLDMNVVEETFLLMPLVYIVLFPGSLWPMAVGGALIASYLPGLPESEFEEFAEDAIELVMISGFATVMTYFQQKSQRQANVFKQASLTDYLTGLDNRKAFYLKLSHLSASDKKDFAAVQVCLDDFKSVNEKLGYYYGDLLLKAFADRVTAILGKQANMYRLGGNDFVILQGFKFGELAQVRGLIEKLVEQYQPKYMVDKVPHKLFFSAGVSLLSDADNNTELWGKNTEAALNMARDDSSVSFRWYDQELLDSSIRQHQIEIEIDKAIAEDGYHLEFQPKVSCKTGKMIGVEALIRWQHPQLGMVAPYEFISIAERTAQIIPIGRLVIKKAIEQGKRWFDKNHEVCISVNVSCIQFVHDDVYEYIARELTLAGLPGRLLQLEITETTLMARHTPVADICAKLQSIGVTIAVDDFGIEYSCLNYLKKLPIDVLKIDKSFIDDCVTSSTDRMIVKTIIQMGQNLGKEVIAEGVEDQEQLEVIRQQGCDAYQGYLYSKAVSVKEVEDLLRRELNW